jgi:hypothetical protein
MSKIGGITLSEMSGNAISGKSCQRMQLMLTVGFILFSGYQVMSLAVLSVFEYANIHPGKAIYDVKVLSEGGGRCCQSNRNSSPFDAPRADGRIYQATSCCHSASAAKRRSL